MTKQKILVSACLLGENCRYDGKSSISTTLKALLEEKEIIQVCPEVEGGLPVPRPPAEILGDKVLRQNGEDVTRQFDDGATACTQTGLTSQVDLAILKSRSPACGCGHIYDGTFTGQLVEGDGMFTRELKAAGIECISDEDYLDGKIS